MKINIEVDLANPHDMSELAMLANMKEAYSALWQIQHNLIRNLEWEEDKDEPDIVGRCASFLEEHINYNLTDCVE